MFQGVYTAIITPFRDGKVDEKKLEELVAFQVKSGVQGIVAGATTGEFVYLSPKERERIFEICVNICKGKVQVLAGTGALTAEEVIANTHIVQKIGANAAFIINPWYVKPSQESLYLYFKKISENVDLPIMAYNNPARTGVDISIDTVLRMAELKNLKGMKDASTSLQRVAEFKRALGDRFSLLAGDDDTLAAYMAMGGDGGVLVASNVAPSLFVALLNAWRKNDLDTFKTTWKKAYPLAATLSLERVKYAMALVHGVSIESRLPFAPLSAAAQESIEVALTGLGLWKPLASVRER